MVTKYLISQIYMNFFDCYLRFFFFFYINKGNREIWIFLLQDYVSHSRIFRVVALTVSQLWP